MIVVVLPTYNEAANLAAMVEAIRALPLPDLRVLVVDDASPDGTGRMAAELAAGSGGAVTVIHRAAKNGLGTAYCQGFNWALAAGADSIIQMDCDFSHSPDYLPQMISQLAFYDVVVGSRYVTNGKLDERWELGR